MGSSRRLRSSSQTQSRNAFLLATDSSSSDRLRRDLLASKQDNTSIDSSLATYASISFVVHDTFTLSTQKTDFLRIWFAAVNLSFDDLDFPKTADVRRCASVVLPALSVGCGNDSGGSRICGKGSGTASGRRPRGSGVWGGGVLLPTGVGYGEGLCPSQ